MNSFRDAFAQVPEIAMRIERSKLKFEPENNCYSTPEWDSTSCSDEGFVNASWWTWQSRQAEIDEKDKRIEELEIINGAGRTARQRFINKFIEIQNHIDVNAFKAMELDPECFVVSAEDLTKFIKEVLRGDPNENS